MITEVDLSGTPCFAPEAELKGLKKVNFIFGPNGTGKTSITRILSQGPDDSRIKLSNESSNREILVLNSTYIEEAFQDAEDGIFFLGTQSIANENDIENNKKKRDQLSEEIESLESDKESAEDKQSEAGKTLLSEIWGINSVSLISFHHVWLDTTEAKQGCAIRSKKFDRTLHRQRIHSQQHSTN